MATVERGVRGTGIRSRLPILVQGSPSGEIESINQYAVTLAGYIYVCAALTKSCSEEKLSHLLTVDRMKFYAVQHISPLLNL